jgi:hypothetical protein
MSISDSFASLHFTYNSLLGPVAELSSRSDHGRLGFVLDLSNLLVTIDNAGQVCIYDQQLEWKS